MRKSFAKMFLLGTLMFASLSFAQAQEDNNLFNHLSLGVNVGSTGIGFELATPITHYVAMRAGMDFMPHFKYCSNVALNIPAGVSLIDNVDIEGKFKMTNGKILFDAYPFAKSSFHITAGAYLGSQEIVTIYNKEDGVLKEVSNYNKTSGAEPIGAKIGDYLLTPDDNGNVKGSVKTKSFRPYVGFGFGRAVPQEHRFALGVDCGVMFWGSPEFYHGENKLQKENLDGGGGFAKTMSKLSVWPCVNIKLVGRLF